MDNIRIVIDMVGAEKAIYTLEELRSLTKSLENKKTPLRFDINDAKRDILAVQHRIEMLKRELADLYAKQRTGLIFTDQDVARVSEIKSEITALKRELFDLREANAGRLVDYSDVTTSLSEANRQLREMERNSITLQDALGGVGNVLSTVGGALTSIGNIFKTDIASYISQTLTQLATKQILSDWSSAFTRYDVLNTFTDYTSVMGVALEDAEESLTRVDAAIQGLPIGLDEAALEARRYAMFFGGDIDKATDLVVGLEQALIAGGAPEQMRSYTKYELERLLASGELATKRQWMTFVNGLGVSTTFLKDAMGYADLTLNEFTEKLFSTNSEITGSDIVQGLINLAGSDELAGMIDIYKSTIESGTSNIKYAIIRGKEHILEALNTSLEDLTGKGISGQLYALRDTIDDIFTGISTYITDNPEKMQDIYDAVYDFFERGREFDWVDLGNRVLDSLKALVNIIKFFYDHVPPKLLSWFVSFSLVWASPLGKAFTALGKVFMALSALPAIPLGKLTRTGKGLEKMFGIFSKTSLKTVGVGFVSVSAFIGIIAEIGLVIAEFAKVAEMIATAELQGFWRNFKKISGFGSIITALAGALTGIATAISSTGIGAMGLMFGELLAAGFVAVIDYITTVIGKIVSLAEQVGTAKLPSDYKIERMGEVLKGLIEQFSDINTVKIIRVGVVRRLSKSVQYLLDIKNSIADFGSAVGLATFGEKAAVMMSGIEDALASVRSVQAVGVKNIKLNNLVGFLNLLDTLGDSYKSAFNAIKPKEGFGERASDMLSELHSALFSASLLPMVAPKNTKLTNLITFAYLLRQLADKCDEFPEMNAGFGERASAALDELSEPLNAVASLTLIAPKNVKLENLTKFAGLVNDLADGISSASASLDGVTGVDTFQSKTDEVLGVLDVTLARVSALPVIVLKNKKLSNIVTFLGRLGDIADEIKTSAPVIDALDVGSFASGVDEMLSALSGVAISVDLSYIGKKKYVSAVSNAVDTVVSMASAISENISTVELAASDAERFASAMQSVFSSISSAFETTSVTSSNGAASLFDYLPGETATTSTVTLKTGKWKRFQLIAQRMSAVVGYIVDIGNTISQNTESLKEIDTETFGEVADSVISAMSQAFETIVGISLNGSVENANEFINSFKRLINIIPIIAAEQDELAQIKTNNIIPSLSDVFNGLTEMVASAPEDLADKSDILSYFIDAIGDIINVVKQIDDMGGTLPDAGSEISSFIGSLTGIFTGKEAEWAIAAAALDNFYQALLQLSELDIASDSETISELGDTVKTLGNNANAAKTALEALKNAIGALADRAEARQDAVDNIAGSINSLRAYAYSAALSVYELGGAISSLQDKTINLTVKTSKVTSSGDNVSYLARGGLARGTDTVPAMLTPGEWVVNRRASRVLGDGFMAKINRLDIGGAVDTLMSRARYAPSRVVAAYTTNTYDNHATVNQTFLNSRDTRSAYRRASRWVAAL